MDASPEKPTLRTIASITGLAVTTVSRALGGAPQIARATRERVQRVAVEIGYLPDRAAQRLRTGRTNVISLVLDPHEELLGFSTSLIRGLTRALRDTRYNLVVTPHFADVPPVAPVEHIVKNRMADGIIFSRTEPSDARVKMLMEREFAFVCHGRTDWAAAHPFVDYDNAKFAALAARRLVKKGRKKLAIILPSPRFNFYRHLRHGFMSVVRATGVDFEIAQGINLDSKSEEIYNWANACFSKPDSPDGFVCSGEVSALAVMACASDRGLKIGVDVDIVTKQTSPLYTHVRPKIDAIYEDLAEAGELMGALLIRRISGEDPASLHILQKPKTIFS